MSDPRRSPSETMMHCMEEFSKSEPVDVMIVWTDESGDLCWSSSSSHLSTRIGMLECAKQYILDKSKEL
jgi:hypothetical protein